MYDEEEINRKIEEWHNDESITMPLHKYLGMTLQEYKDWIGLPISDTAKVTK